MPVQQAELGRGRRGEGRALPPGRGRGLALVGGAVFAVFSGGLFLLLLLLLLLRRRREPRRERRLQKLPERPLLLLVIVSSCCCCCRVGGRVEGGVLGVVEERVPHRVGPLVCLLGDLLSPSSLSLLRGRRRTQGRAGVEQRQRLPEAVQPHAQLPRQQRRGVASAPGRGVGRQRGVAAKVGGDARDDRRAEVDGRGQPPVVFLFLLSASSSGSSSSSRSFSARGDRVRPAPGAGPGLQHRDAYAAAGEVQGGAEAVRFVDPQETFSWRSGRLVYRNQPLAEVVDDLNR